MSRRLKATLIVTVLLYGTLLYSVFADSAFWVRAFGFVVAGLPAPVLAAMIVTLLYLPAPWIVWHGLEIVLRGREAGMPLGHLGIFYTLFTIGRHLPELRGSQRVAIGGFFYFVAIIAAWIWYADAHGL